MCRRTSQFEDTRRIRSFTQGRTSYRSERQSSYFYAYLIG